MEVWRKLIRRVIEQETDVSTHFQPILDIRTIGQSRIVGYEALSRFAPVTTDVPLDRQTPGNYFAQAADLGLALDMEHLCMIQALREARKLPPEYWVSINAGVDLILSPRFADTIRTYADRRVVVELTEYERVTDYESLRSAIRVCKDLDCGVELAIDDVGAGFASMLHILNLYPDMMKMTGDLTRRVDQDGRRAALVNALVSFSFRVGAQLIAEGIETEAEMIAVRAIGVCYGQGYLFGPPAPVKAYIPEETS